MVLDHFFPALHSLSLQLLVHTHLAHFYQLALHHLTVVHLHWLLDFDYLEQVLLVVPFLALLSSGLQSVVSRLLVDSRYSGAGHWLTDSVGYVKKMECRPESTTFLGRVEAVQVVVYLVTLLLLMDQ